VHLHFPSQITGAREINGAEEPVGSAQISNGDLVTDFTGYQPRSFALKLAPPTTQLAAVQSEPVTLPYDRAVATFDGHPTSGSFDNAGKALPAEMLSTDIAYNGIHFKLAPAGTGTPDAVTAQGQTIALPAGGFDTIYLLAAAADGDHAEVFHVGDQEARLDVEDWGGFIGQWDNRSWKAVEVPTPDEPKSDDKSPDAEHARRVRAYVKQNGPITRDEFAVLAPAFIKPAPVAWFASHRHDSAGNNEPYSYSYLFAYRLRVPAGATTLKLPRNKDIKILALSVAKEADEVQSVQPLYDVFPKADPSATK
jgi:alpha-mannosidase